MEFNISQKTDSETKHSTFTVEGDEDFMGVISVIINALKEVLLMMPYALGKKGRQNEKYNSPVRLRTINTIKMDKSMANIIIDNNPDLFDRIALIKNADGKVIAITIN
ncbi:hypothetical protein LCGC14_0225540 [marine sediment metagenome]|uniref:Uncharacterized protein n=1 Tax=marine sediment metagenome TaxID=412755 RepID=A0A0F9UCR6_9ZZZZ